MEYYIKGMKLIGYGKGHDGTNLPNRKVVSETVYRNIENFLVKNAQRIPISDSTAQDWQKDRSKKSALYTIDDNVLCLSLQKDFVSVVQTVKIIGKSSTHVDYILSQIRHHGEVYIDDWLNLKSRTIKLDYLLPVDNPIGLIHQLT
jgi:hypothetical protein